MAKHLVIVESPAKAKTLGKYLGRNYQVKASVGHVMDLPKSKLGVDMSQLPAARLMGPAAQRIKDALDEQQKVAKAAAS